MQRATGLVAPMVCVRRQRLDHLRVDPQDRIQRHHRILEDHRDPVAADRAQSAGTALTRSSPSKRIRPAAIRPGGSISPMIENPVTDLPDPDSPTSPSTSPRCERERDLVDGAQQAVAGLEFGRQPLDREQRRRPARGFPCRPHLAQPRIEDVADLVADQVDRQDGQQQRHARDRPIQYLPDSRNS